MSWLKIYDWEHETYPEFQKVEIAHQDAQRYFRKLARHFKVTTPTLSLRLKRGGGTYYSRSAMIRLSRISNLGIVIHEFAHHLADCTTRSRNSHNKSFKKALKKTYTFARRYLK